MGAKTGIKLSLKQLYFALQLILILILTTMESFIRVARYALEQFGLIPLIITGYHHLSMISIQLSTEQYIIEQ
jgi:hypothetical protein